MKRRYLSSLDTRSEASQRRVFLFDVKRELAMRRGLT